MTTWFHGDASLKMIYHCSVAGIDKEVEVQSSHTGESTVSMEFIVPDQHVSLWWPNGYGKQPLYDLNIVLKTLNNETLGQTSKKVGFRTVELIQVKYLIQ